jgi:hypothetical protein
VARRVSHPHVVVAVDGDAPRPNDALPGIKRRQDRAIGPHHGNVASGKLLQNFKQADPHLGGIFSL